MCDFGPRPFLESFDLGLDVRSVLFVLPTSSIKGALRLGDRSLPSLSFLLLGGLFGTLGLRHALLCATYSRCPTLSTFPLPPFDDLSNDRYRLRPSQRSQHSEWPLCARSCRSVSGALDAQLTLGD